jgi:hypothetical protein
MMGLKGTKSAGRRQHFAKDDPLLRERLQTAYDTVAVPDPPTTGTRCAGPLSPGSCSVGISRPFLNVSEDSQKFRHALQYAVDAAYISRFGRSHKQIKSDLTARLGRLRFELDAGEIDEWALEISEGQRIQIRIQGGSRL